MNYKSTNKSFYNMLALILYLLPVISFILCVANFLKFGVDMPMYDDWREYRMNVMGNFDINYLFKPVNDTLSPLGLALDSLVFKLFLGNSIAYQFFSLVIIQGGILLVSYKLLRVCSNNNLHKALCFSLLLLILQPDTYWGFSNLAFHQAIPLLCILLSIYIYIIEIRFKSLILAILSFCAGLSYTSGAFGILAAGITLMLLKILSPKEIGLNTKYKQCLAILVPGIITSLAQLWVIIGVQHGTHRADAPMAYPWELDFWLYALGKVSRSLLLPSSLPLLSIILTMAIIILLVGYNFKALKEIAIGNNARRNVQNKNLNVVLLTLTASVFVYLMLVSAGRTNLRDPNITEPLEIFISGYARFHFYWLTILWPFIALTIITKINKKWFDNLAIVFVSLYIIITVMFSSLMNHGVIFQNAQKLRLDGIQCIQSALKNNNEQIVCPSLLPGQNLAPMIKNARSAGASFVHFFPFTPLGIHEKSATDLFRLSDDYNNIGILNATRLKSKESNLLHLSAERDSNLLINIPAEQARKCTVLEVDARIINRIENDFSQLFYMPLPTSSFSEGNSQVIPLIRKESQEINYMIESKTGFNSILRFDPINDKGVVEIQDIVVRCRNYQ